MLGLGTATWKNSPVLLKMGYLVALKIRGVIIGNHRNTMAHEFWGGKN